MKPKGTILIVDDSDAMLSLISEVLRSENYSVVIAESGEKAIEILTTIVPDLILLDRTLPGMDGFEVCNWIKSNRKHAKIPIIFLTASSDTKEKVYGFRIGAVDYITKPFEKEELLARVNSHFELYRLSILLKEQTESLKESEKNLKEVVTTKDKFFSIIAHDLKGPFNNILGITQLLVEKYSANDTDNLAELIKTLYISVDNTNDLLLTLLDWALIQRGRMPFNPEKVLVNQIVKDCIKTLEGQAQTKSILIENLITPDTYVYADINMLKGVIRNLVSNAIKFTGRGGSISIRGDNKINMFEICVSDNGIGIEEKTLKYFFKINKVESNYGTEGEPGTGLGLILCKDFIEKHGGKLWIDSTVGVGSKFYFTLPYL